MTKEVKLQSKVPVHLCMIYYSILVKKQSNIKYIYKIFEYMIREFIFKLSIWAWNMAQERIFNVVDAKALQDI